MTCTFAHAISASDLEEGSIFNSVAATGRPPTGEPVRSPVAHVTVRGMLWVPPPPLPEVPVTG
jgi:hypothetical protein